MDSIHIIGGGPAGIALSWILADSYTVHLYDVGETLGGSWKESLKDVNKRKLHAHRIVFNYSSPYFKKLMSDMNIDFYSHFIKYDESSSKTIQSHISILELLKLCTLLFRHSKDESVFEFTKAMSSNTQKIMNALCLSMDGVNSKKMSTHLFVKIIQNVIIDLILGTVYTQKHSGFYLFDEIENKLIQKGIHIHKLHKLTRIDTENKFLQFNGKTIVNYKTCCLCLDSLPLSHLFNEFKHILKKGTYGSICIMFYFDTSIELKNNSLHFTAHTPWNLIVDVLPDRHTICCVICDSNISNNDSLKPITTSPSILVKEVWKQIETVEPIEKYSSYSFGTGSYWSGSKWIIEQSGYSNSSSIPYKYNDSVFICGTMSQRTTPYGSFESSVESASILANQYFSMPVYKGSNVYRFVFIFIFFIIGIKICK